MKTLTCSKCVKIAPIIKVFFLLLAGQVGLAKPVHSELLPENTQIHGFASQGFILTSKNRFFGDSEEGTFRFSELGLNTSIQVNPHLQLSAQALSRQAGPGDKGDIHLDFGMLDFKWVSNEKGELGTRVGRIKNPLGFYNDTRDVAFTRPSIFLPQSIYFDRTRNLALSADGASLYTEYRTLSGNYFYELEVGYPDVDDRETVLSLIGNLDGSLKHELSYITRFLFEKGGGNFRLGISGASLNIKFRPGSSSLPEGKIRFRPLILSLQYNAEEWSLTSEYALRYFRYQNVGTANSVSKLGESIYLQGTYRIIPQVEALVRYDLSFQDRNDRNGKEFAATDLAGRPAHIRFAKDLTVGLLWDITYAWMARIEYHYVEGTAWLPALDNPDLSSTHRYWDMVAILLSYRF